MEADDLLCSRNARPGKGLVRRPHVDQHGYPSEREKQASLEGTFILLEVRVERAHSYRARSASRRTTRLPASLTC
jgi:hypothetical protein